MPSYSRELTVLGLLGATLLVPNCSQLTKVDWSIIPPAGGGSGGAGGSAGGEPQAGAMADAGEGAAAGESGAGGESGEAGSAGDVQGGGGSGGSVGGGAGKGGAGGAGLGGTSGNGGSGGELGGAPGHTTCSTAPTPPAVLPDISKSIVLFDGGTASNGNRGGRTGLDAACRAAKTTLNLPQAETRAVISVELDIPRIDDQILTMSTNYQIPRERPAVVSPIGIQIAASWDALWGNVGALPSLVCTGVMPATSRRWLTGSNGRAGALITNGPTFFGLLDTSTSMDGKVYDNACKGWTLGTADPGFKAHVGSTTADRDPGSDGHPRFIDWLIVECSAADYNILCVAYDKVP